MDELPSKLIWDEERISALKINLKETTQNSGQWDMQMENTKR